MLELPLIFMNDEEGKENGNTIGEVIEVETQADDSGWGSFLRLLLLMDLSKPLARGRTISVKGLKYWIPLRHEKLHHHVLNLDVLFIGKELVRKKLELRVNNLGFG